MDDGDVPSNERSEDQEDVCGWRGRIGGTDTFDDDIERFVSAFIEEGL